MKRMFGYLRPLVSELRVRELEYYRAVYCGVCRSMGKSCGAASRLCLSYDLTFLAMLTAALSGEKTGFGKKICSCPAGGRKKTAVGSASVDYAGAVCGMLASLRFADDAADERGLRRTASRLLGALSGPWAKRAGKLYPGLEEGTLTRLSALSEAEKEAAGGGRRNGEADPGGECRPDAPADSCASLFGELLSFLCSYPFADEKFRRERTIASAVGYSVGRWIYLVDAADDMKEDAKHLRFNPLSMTFGKDELTKEEKTTLGCTLAAEAGSAADAMLLFDAEPGAAPEPAAVIGNILTKGMRSVAEAVLDGSYRKPVKDRL